MRPTTAVLHASPPRGEGFRVFTNGRYRRRHAQFTFTAVNREVGWIPVHRQHTRQTAR
jgi:hypothetical protein